MKNNNYNKLKFVGLFLFFFFSLFSFEKNVDAFSGTQMSGVSITSGGNITFPTYQVACTGSETVHAVIFQYVDEATNNTGVSSLYNNVTCGTDERGSGYDTPGYAGFAGLTWDIEAGFTPFTGGKTPPVTFGYYYFRDGLGCSWYGSSCVPNNAVAGNVKFTRTGSVWTVDNGVTPPYTADSSISWFTSPDWNTESSNATTTTNTTFTFNYAINSNEFNNYTYGFSYGQACLNIARNGISSSTPTNNIGTYTKICQPITADGTGTFSTTTQLTNNTLYSYFGSIEATSTDVFPSNKTTLTNSLQIGTVNGSGIVPAGWVQQFDANSTSTDSTAFGSFLNVPELLKTKVPFGYIYQIGTIMFNAGSSTSATIPGGTFDVDFASGTPAYKKLQIDMFSTTTITHFLNPTLIGTLRSLLIAIEWVAFALYLWKRGHSIIT